MKKARKIYIEREMTKIHKSSKNLDPEVEAEKEIEITK